MTEHESTSLPKYTVSGNHMRLMRLDPEGQPIGEPVEVEGHVSFDINADDVLDTHLDVPTDTFTMEVTMDGISDEMFSLLTGQPWPPRQAVKRTWWQRVVGWLKGWLR